MLRERGLYSTDAGSTVEVSGKHNGIYHIDFDWLEEGACCLEAEPYILDDCLCWCCPYHEGDGDGCGSAVLALVSRR